MGFKEDNVGKLEDEAQKRKQRLLALKKRKLPDEPTDAVIKRQDTKNGISAEEDLPTSQVLFRNYQPLHEKLESSALPQTEPSNVEELVQAQLEDVADIKEVDHIETSTLAPKKVTFDLRRGIEKQLSRLERRTEKSIAELIRERLKEGKQQDFLLAVNTGANLQKKTALDSDEED